MARHRHAMMHDASALPRQRPAGRDVATLAPLPHPMHDATASIHRAMRIGAAKSVRFEKKNLNGVRFENSFKKVLKKSP